MLAQVPLVNPIDVMGKMSIVQHISASTQPPPALLLPISCLHDVGDWSNAETCEVCCAATASMAIHQAETAEIVRKALSEQSWSEQEGSVVSLPA